LYLIVVISEVNGRRKCDEIQRRRVKKISDEILLMIGRLKQKRKKMKEKIVPEIGN